MFYTKTTVKECIMTALQNNNIYIFKFFVLLQLIN